MTSIIKNIDTTYDKLSKHYSNSYPLDTAKITLVRTSMEVCVGGMFLIEVNSLC